MDSLGAAQDAARLEDEEASPPSRGDEREVKTGVLIGLVSGLAAITCCVSPVVMVLIGVATAAEAVTLGNTLYYSYGWACRAIGLVIATVAVVLYLRERRSCNPQGVRVHWRMVLTLVLSGAAAYASLFWFTKYLGIWFA